MVFIVTGLSPVNAWLISTEYGMPNIPATAGALSILMGLGFWQHRKWVRTLGLIGGWPAAVLFVAFVVAGKSQIGSLTISLNDMSFSDLSFARDLLAMGEMAVLFFGFLVVLHSKQAKREFSGAAEPPPEPAPATTVNPTPTASAE